MRESIKQLFLTSIMLVRVELNLNLLSRIFSSILVDEKKNIILRWDPLKIVR